MMEIYSYWEQKGNKVFSETLLEHIVEALNLLNLKENSKIDIFGNRLSPRFNDIVRLTVIFHDIGKLFYQTSYYIDREKKHQIMSFRGHEYFSTYIFQTFRINLLERSLLKDEDIEMFVDYGAVVFSILYHHHAMGTKKREYTLHRRSLEKSLLLLDRLRNYMRELNRNGWLTDEEYDVIVFTLNKEYILSFSFIPISAVIKEYIDDIWRETIKNPKFRRLCLLSLMTLITVDYISAARRRSVSATRFSKILREFYEYYFSPLNSVSKDVKNILK